MLAGDDTTRRLDNQRTPPEHDTRMASSARRRRLSVPVPAARHGRPTRIRPGTLPGTLAGKAPETPPRITLMAFTRETLDEREFSAVDEMLSAIPALGVTWIKVDG